MTRPTPAGRTAGDTGVNGRVALTREAVLAAALEIIDRDGSRHCRCAASPAPWAETR
jgi:hypothetical protein